jgi:hypothetical protein
MPLLYVPQALGENSKDSQPVAFLGCLISLSLSLVFKGMMPLSANTSGVLRADFYLLKAFTSGDSKVVIMDAESDNIDSIFSER